MGEKRERERKKIAVIAHSKVLPTYGKLLFLWDRFCYFYFFFVCFEARTRMFLTLFYRWKYSLLQESREITCNIIPSAWNSRPIVFITSWSLLFFIIVVVIFFGCFFFANYTPRKKSEAFFYYLSLRGGGMRA